MYTHTHRVFTLSSTFINEILCDCSGSVDQFIWINVNTAIRTLMRFKLTSAVRLTYERKHRAKTSKQTKNRTSACCHKMPPFKRTERSYLFLYFLVSRYVAYYRCCFDSIAHFINSLWVLSWEKYHHVHTTSALSPAQHTALFWMFKFCCKIYIIKAFYIYVYIGLLLKMTAWIWIWKWKMTRYNLISCAK